MNPALADILRFVLPGLVVGASVALAIYAAIAFAGGDVRAADEAAARHALDASPLEGTRSAEPESTQPDRTGRLDPLGVTAAQRFDH